MEDITQNNNTIILLNIFYYSNFKIQKLRYTYHYIQNKNTNNMIFQMLTMLLLSSGFQLQESVNPMTEFQPAVPAFSHGNGLIYIPNVTNVSYCAQECLNLGDGTLCNSFDYSSVEQICDLNVHILSRDVKLKPSVDYEYYRRILDTHVQNTPRQCPQVLPCFCDHHGSEWKNYYTIQGNCIDCTCKKMRQNTICSVNKECDCEPHEIKIYKRDLNECLLCSCESLEMNNETDGVDYKHLQVGYLQLNTGGSGYIGDDGDLWKRDAYYHEGKVRMFSNKTIQDGNNTIDVAYNYRSNRYSDSSFGYHIPIDRKGDYLIRFYFFNFDSGVNHFHMILPNNDVHELTLNDTGLYTHEDTLRLYDPFVSFEFKSVDLDNMTELNYTSVPFVSAIDIIYLYPLDGLNMTEPIDCDLPNCTCSENQTVRFYQNDSETPCYNCECSDIPVEIRIRNITIPCPTYTTTTCPSLPLTTTVSVTTLSTTTLSTNTKTTTTTIDDQQPKSETPNDLDESTDENNQAMTMAGIISVTLLSLVLVVFVILLIFMIRQNSVIKARNRFLEEDTTRRSIKQEVTQSYDNPLFVSSHYDSVSFQGPRSQA